MGRLGVANVSVGLAFIVVYFLPVPSRYVLPKEFFNLALAYGLGPVNFWLLSLFVNCGLLAFVLYVVLRLVRIEQHVAAPPLTQAAVALGNALLVFAAVTVALSAGKPVADMPSSSRFVHMAGWWLTCGGLALALAASIGRRGEERERVPVTLKEGALALVLVGVPGLIALNALYGKNGALRTINAAMARFETLCQSAGERIVKPLTEEVEGAYFDPTDLLVEYTRIENGVYSGTGWRGHTGQNAVATGVLRFVETPNPRGAGHEPPYFRYAPGSRAGEPVGELQSRYAVRTRELLGPEDAKVGLKGTEISVIDLRSNDTIAASTYYVARWQMRFCGHVEENRNFLPSSFVQRALNLRGDPLPWVK